MKPFKEDDDYEDTNHRNKSVFKRPMKTNKKTKAGANV